MRCPTYETLEELAKQRANLIMQALTLIQLSETFDINLGKGWRKFKDDAKAIGLEVKKNS